MATITITQPQAVRTRSGQTIQTAVYDIASTSTLIAGQLVKLSAGKIVVVATDPQAGIVGMCAHNANTAAAASGGSGMISGTFDGSTELYKSIENSGMHVELAVTDNIFEINFSGTLAATQIGTAYGVTLDATTGHWYLDSSKTTSGTNTVMTMIGYYNSSDKGLIGDTYARVLAQFLPSVTLSLT